MAAKFHPNGSGGCITRPTCHPPRNHLSNTSGWLSTRPTSPAPRTPTCPTRPPGPRSNLGNQINPNKIPSQSEPERERSGSHGSLALAPLV
eukprot:maker-scaffold372_size192401-snap-gene-0.46 protein:Tk00579 transcript:maker-scaffold372_size192401-snap-gene-0.46-mRNA-1 annotation:"hypothetical protein"